MRGPALLVLLLALVACREDGRPRAASPPATAADTGSDNATADTSASDWTVRADRLGALQAGMSLAHASRLLGDQLRVRQRECDHVTSTRLPAGVRLMVVRDTVVRIEVDSAGVKTADGAQVGDSESRVLELYGARARIEPHKYTYPAGHYLVVAPPGDSVHRLIFETLNGRVTTYRAGRLPAVGWVEGCS